MGKSFAESIRMYPNVSKYVKTGPKRPENVGKLREIVKKLRENVEKLRENVEKLREIIENLHEIGEKLREIVENRCKHCVYLQRRAERG